MTAEEDERLEEAADATAVMDAQEEESIPLDASNEDETTTLSTDLTQEQEYLELPSEENHEIQTQEQEDQASESFGHAKNDVEKEQHEQMEEVEAMDDAVPPTDDAIEQQNAQKTVKNAATDANHEDVEGLDGDGNGNDDGDNDVVMEAEQPEDLSSQSTQQQQQEQQYPSTQQQEQHYSSSEQQQQYPSSEQLYASEQQPQHQYQSPVKVDERREILDHNGSPYRYQCHRQEPEFYQQHQEDNQTHDQHQHPYQHQEPHDPYQSYQLPPKKHEGPTDRSSSPHIPDHLVGTKRPRDTRNPTPSPSKDYHNNNNNNNNSYSYDNTKRNNSSSFSWNDILRVQNLIERCLQQYLTKNEILVTLQAQANIDPEFTSIVWQKLEEQNPSFFKAYNLQLQLKDQILAFNYLVSQQKELTARTDAAMGNYGYSSLPSLPSSESRGSYGRFSQRSTSFHELQPPQRKMTLPPHPSAYAPPSSGLSMMQIDPPFPLPSPIKTDLDTHAFFT